RIVFVSCSSQSEVGHGYLSPRWPWAKTGSVRPRTVRWPCRRETITWPKRPSDGPNDTMQMNRVVIAGYVPKKPEVRYLPSGTPVVNVRVGESVRYADGSGETREHTNWHSLSFYGKLAQVARALEKGDN